MHFIYHSPIVISVHSAYNTSLIFCNPVFDVTIAKHPNAETLLMPNHTTRKLRSQIWFDNPDNPGMTALYLERYHNFGLTREELQSGKPIIGIAQTGSDLSPCNRHHIVLAERVREGIRTQG